MASRTDCARTSIFSETFASRVLRSASGRLCPDPSAASTRSAAAFRVSSAASALDGLGALAVGDVERLRALRSVAIDGDGLQALTPGLEVSLGDVVDGAVVRQVDGLRDGSGEERLRRGHHLDVAHVVDRARALRRLEGAVEDGQVLGLDAGRAFDGAGGVDVADDGVHLVVVVAELEERGGHGVVDDLDHAAADQLLVLDQREIGLDAGRVAVHHEADGAGGREHGDLRVAIAVLLAVRERLVPAVAAGLDEGVELRDGERLGTSLRLADVVDLGAVHADDVEERLAVDVVAGAGSAFVIDARRCSGVAEASGGHFSAMREDCRYASPHMMAVRVAAKSRPASES